MLVRKPVRRRTYSIGKRAVNREIAALEFLLSVPLAAEAGITARGRQRHHFTSGGGGESGKAILSHPKDRGNDILCRTPPQPDRFEDDDSQSLTDADEVDPNSEGVEDAGVALSVSPAILGGSTHAPAPGRRLQGPMSVSVGIPITFRHCLLKLPGGGADAAVIKQWEREILSQGVTGGRIFMSGSKGYPVALCSIIHYQPKEEEAKRRLQRWADERGAEAFIIPRRDWRGLSYGHLLSTSTNRYEDEGIAGKAVSTSEVYLGDKYSPGVLDDPEMTAGRHKQVLKDFQRTGPVICSILQFVRPQELKEELNRQFREHHPDLPPSLTLSKIRSIKRQALMGSHEVGIEVATVALAWVYFERLCLRGLITKANRRLTMAGCLALAYKFSEPLLMESKLPALFRFFDSEWQVAKKKVLDAEFGVLVQLRFNLQEHPHHINYHFVRLLRVLELNPRKYLGESMLYHHQEALRAASLQVVGENQVAHISSPNRASMLPGANEDVSPRLASNASLGLHETGSVPGSYTTRPGALTVMKRMPIFRGAANALRNRKRALGGLLAFDANPSKKGGR